MVLREDTLLYCSQDKYSLWIEFELVFLPCRFLFCTQPCTVTIVILSLLLYVTAQGLRTSGTRRERLGRAVGVGCRYERPEGVRKEQGRQGIGKGRSCIKVSFK